ncbi:MAG: SPOR domain-containing protein, partial [Gammaproteobacteria bacterium]
EEPGGEPSENTKRARTSADGASSALPAVADAASSSSVSSRCVSVGPFNDLATAARSAALLRGRGFEPRQRAEAGEMWAGYWVYVGGLSSPADEAKVMKTLERAGISDAATMPATDSGRRVSVGLFSERERAQKRADAVKRLGFAPEITERKQPGTIYWVDLELSASDRTVPTEGLLSGEEAGSRLEIRMCPTEAPKSDPPRQQKLRDARPASTTADARSARPG